MGINFKIITPVYNAAEWIEKCINSVKEQTHGEFHQIIIDDNSLDDTVKNAISAPRWSKLGTIGSTMKALYLR